MAIPSNCPSLVTKRYRPTVGSKAFELPVTRAKPFLQMAAALTLRQHPAEYQAELDRVFGGCAEDGDAGAETITEIACACSNRARLWRGGCLEALAPSSLLIGGLNDELAEGISQV